MACLTPEQIELLVGGAVDPTRSTELRRHAERCAACGRQLAEWRANEAVLRRVKQLPRVGVPAPDDPREPDRRPLEDVASPKTLTQISLDPSATRLTPPGAKSAEPSPLPASRAGLFPGYEVIRELNRGGQGVVYEALQAGTHRRVAIKVLREGAHATDSAIRRFEREIELVAQLKHANIVAIFHSGTAADGQRFYAMDYVDGVPLREHVRRRNLTLEQLLGLFGEVCDAVEHAHRRGVIHRDLKPSNILVDREGHPKILDFGLARQLLEPADRQITLSHEVMGTLPYMSPEQARGDTPAIDTRTDVYALGVVLYELLTGHFPYPVQGQLWEVVRNIAETPPTPPIQRWSHESGVTRRSSRRLRARRCPIDDELQTIILKTLAKERERRYQSVVELGRDIRHYLAGEAIEAKRDSAWYVLRKLAQRNRAASTIAASVFVIAISAACISFEFYRDARQALAAQLASDQLAAQQARDFEATGEAARAGLHRLSLGWFLDEWHAGRRAAARRILAQMPRQLPEYVAMSFLLDPNTTPEQLLAQVPPESAALAHFVIGEREWQAGRASEARHWWELCLAREPQGQLGEAVRARLNQPVSADSESDPTRQTQEPAHEAVP